MRNSDFNVIKGLSEKYSRQESLALFERMTLVRYFEAGAIDAINERIINYYVYLSSGEEAVASALSLSVRDYMIFAQHRAHDLYLTFGGDPVKLRDELLGRPGGTSGGRAGSNCIQCFENGITMYGHHGLIGENVPQAVGAALGSGRNTLAVFGDGAAEEDYVHTSLGFASTHKLPVLFVCVDNDLSILTTTSVRRSWKLVDVARSFNIPAVDISDDPWTILENVRNLKNNLPALINCRVCRAFWHVGAGDDGPPAWDRYTLTRNELLRLRMKADCDETERRVKADMEKLWAKELSLRQLRK
jgi:acetoin:2,6-dichlorophenolindophenol oxidoreductase subunit alpha